MNLQEWGNRLLEKVKKWSVKEWGMLLLAGVCCLVIVFPEKKEEPTAAKEEKKQSFTGEKAEETGYVAELEQRLTELLSLVENVGRVKVMITVESSTERVVLKDGTKESEKSTETDSAGGSRNEVSEREEGTTVFSEESGKNSPYILTERYPAVSGVVVLAEGSGRGTVDMDILNAVQVLFDVPAHKIKIMKMK